MRRIILPISTLLLLGLAAVSNATPFVTLNFNTLIVGEQVLNYYDGGFGSLGSGPGPNFGVTFTPDVVIVPEGVPFGNVLQGAQVSSGGIMDVNGGFSGPFSFYYSSGSGAVQLFSGLDGSGTQVGTIALAPEAGFFPAGNPEPFFESAVFQLSGPSVIIDDVTFGGIVVPEPALAALMAMGIGVLILWGRFRG
jgi:hypothetical protein